MASTATVNRTDPTTVENPLAIDYHALNSLAATLDDVVDRIGAVARSAGDDEDAAVDLQEIERQLTTASRRLTKVVRRHR